MAVSMKLWDDLPVFVKVLLAIVLCVQGVALVTWLKYLKNEIDDAAAKKKGD